MTNNKTFTSTFLTCPVQARSCGLICLLSMDYSNENRINACKNNISESCSCFPFFVLFKHIKTWTSRPNHIRVVEEGSRMTNYFQIYSTFLLVYGISCLSGFLYDENYTYRDSFFLLVYCIFKNMSNKYAVCLIIKEVYILSSLLKRAGAVFKWEILWSQDFWAASILQSADDDDDWNST